MPDPDLTTPPATIPAPAAPPPVKPGYKTTEYWLTKLAILLTALYATGIIPTTGKEAQLAAIAASVLGVFGYAVIRGNVKNTAAVTAGAPGFIGTKLMLLLGSAGLAFALVAGSGCTKNTRTDTIHAALVSLDAARDGYLAYDASAQARIVASAASGSAARQELADYRAERDNPVGPGGLLLTAYRALAAAGAANDAGSLEGAQTAVVQLLATLKPYLTGGAK